MSSDSYSQSQISTYLKCQRQYQYRYERGVAHYDDTKNLDFGRALHETISQTCDQVRTEEEFDDEEIREVVIEVFEQQWDAEVESGSYQTDAHYKDDKQLARRAIEEFFDEGPGIDHARRSLVTELPVGFERNSISYSGYIDNVLKTDDGIELIDYKKSKISEPVTSRKNHLRAYNEGEYKPKRMKNAIQAEIYIEAIKQTEYFDPGDEVKFTYQPLAAATVDRKGQEISYELDFKPIDQIEQQVSENSQIIWGAIEQAINGIRRGDFDPNPFEDIKDNQCDRCPYQQMCTAYITNEEIKL